MSTQMSDNPTVTPTPSTSLDSPVVGPVETASGFHPTPAPKDPLPELLARISAIEADIAQSKAKISDALGKLLANPPTL